MPIFAAMLPALAAIGSSAGGAAGATGLAALGTGAAGTAAGAGGLALAGSAAGNAASSIPAAAASPGIAGSGSQMMSNALAMKPMAPAGASIAPMPSALPGGGPTGITSSNWAASQIPQTADAAMKSPIFNQGGGLFSSDTMKNVGNRLGSGAQQGSAAPTPLQLTPHQFGPFQPFAFDRNNYRFRRPIGF